MRTISPNAINDFVFTIIFIYIYIREKEQEYKLFENIGGNIRTNRVDILSTFLMYHGEMFRANAMDICNYPRNDRNSCEKLLLRIDVRVKEGGKVL